MTRFVKLPHGGETWINVDQVARVGPDEGDRVRIEMSDGHHSFIICGTTVSEVLTLLDGREH